MRPASCAAIVAQLDGGLREVIHRVHAKSSQDPAKTSQVLEGEGGQPAWGFKGLLGRLWGKAS